MRTIIVTVAVLLLVACPVLGQSPTRYVDPCIGSGIKDTVVFLGRLVPPSKAGDQPQPEFVGTGFLVSIDTLYYVVTARHVIEGFRRMPPPTPDLTVFFRQHSGRYLPISTAQNQHDLGVDWLLSPSSDLAIVPIGIPSAADVKVIPESFFLPAARLGELLDVFFASYQPGVQGAAASDPILRRGMISRFNEDGTFYIDAFAFPGNSGSPVFLRSTPFTVGNQPEGCSFIGVLGEYLTYAEAAVSVQTQRPRVVFEENTGLAKVWPVEALRGLVSSLNFEAQRNELKRRLPKPAPN